MLSARTLRRFLWILPVVLLAACGVGQGNNNPGGSHNGSQAFAFDFSLPSGTEVRAARAGTVEWFQQSQTSTYNPNQPTTASNTPYPAGNLQNWGNTVRIRHLGGFTSWYFHLTPNSVKVKVGDKVEAGTVIAYGDRTLTLDCTVMEGHRFAVETEHAVFRGGYIE